MESHIFDFIHRWRHTRGYGVHSPLAYRIIKECIYPDTRYAYYADAIIRSYSENAEMSRELRLTIRLINTLHLHNVWMPDSPKKIITLLKKGYPSLNISIGPKPSKNTDFIVVFDINSTKIQSKLTAEDEDFTILHFHPQGKSSEISHNATLTLISSTFTLYIRREGMQAISYTLP